MATKVWGCSDDLVEVDGDVRGEVGCYGTDDRDKGLLLICSDGTLLEAKYGKAGMGVWQITVVKKGDLFEDIDLCCDEDSKPYNDVAHFKDGLKWVYSAPDWALVE